MAKRILSLTNLDAHVKTDDNASGTSTITLTSDLLGYNEYLTGAGDSSTLAVASYVMGTSTIVVNTPTSTILAGSFAFGMGIGTGVTVASVSGSGPYTVTLTGATSPTALIGVTGTAQLVLSSTIGVFRGQTISGANVGTGATTITSVDYRTNTVQLSTVNSGTVTMGAALVITNPAITTPVIEFNSPTATATGGVYTAVSRSLTLTSAAGSTVVGQYISGVGIDAETKIIATTGVSGSITVILSKPMVSAVSGNYFLSSQFVTITSATWAGGGGSTILSCTRTLVPVFSMLTAYSSSLNLVGANFYDNVGGNADIVLAVSAGVPAQCWIRLRKVAGYKTYFAPEQMGSYSL